MDWKIFTHERPDIDALTAIWLLRRFGEQKFPGIAKATLGFFRNGGELPDGLTARDLEERGVICVDTGGGRFDHHPQASHGEDSAATLVAKYLGVDENPALGRILKFVKDADLKGTTSPFDIGYLVRIMSNSPEQVIGWAFQALDAKYKEQLEFFSEAQREYEQKAKAVEVILADGRVLRVVTIQSGNEQISKFARWQGAAVVIQQQPSGNVQITTNRKFGLTLYDLAQIIRLEEQRAKGNMKTTDWQTLSSEGKVEGAEEWYFHVGLQALLNGSSTAPNIPPTRLSLKRITELVVLGINPSWFPNHTCANHRGICSGEKCSYYAYGLHRCRRLRYETRQNNFSLNRS